MNYQQLFPSIRIKASPFLSRHRIVNYSLNNVLADYDLEGREITCAMCKAYNNSSFNKVMFDFSEEGYVTITFVSPQPIPYMGKPNTQLFRYMPNNIQALWDEALKLVFNEEKLHRSVLAILANYILSFDNFIQNKGNLTTFLRFNDFELASKNEISKTFGRGFFQKLEDVLKACWKHNISCGRLNSFDSSMESTDIVFDGQIDKKLKDALLARIQDTLPRTHDVPSAIETLFCDLTLTRNGNNPEIKVAYYGFTALSIYSIISDYCPFIMDNNKTKQILQQLDHLLLFDSVSCRYMFDAKTNRWILVYFTAYKETLPIQRLSQLALCVYKSINDIEKEGAVYKDIFSEMMGVVNHECKDARLDDVFDISLSYDTNWQLMYKLPDGENYYNLVSRLISCSLFQNLGDTIGRGDVDDLKSAYKLDLIDETLQIKINEIVVKAYNEWKKSEYSFSYAYPVLNRYFIEYFAYDLVKTYYKDFLNKANYIIRKIGDDKETSKYLILNLKYYNFLAETNKALQPFVISPGIRGDYGYFVYLQHLNIQLFKVKLWTSRAQVLLNIMVALYNINNLMLARSYMDTISPFLKQYDADLKNISDFIRSKDCDDCHNSTLYGMIMKYIDILQQ